MPALAALRDHLARRWAWWLGFVLGLWVLGPGVWRPTTHFIGTEYIDTHGTLWFFWWVEEALRTGQDPMHSSALFHPWGKDLYAHTGGNILDGLLAVPLRWLFGPVLGMNLWVAALLMTNALATGLLARALGAPVAGQRLAALLGLLNPVVIYEIGLGRPTQGLLAPSILFMASLAGEPGWRKGVWGGLCLGASGLVYWYYGLLGAMVGAVAAVVLLVTRSGRLATALQLGVAAVVSIVVVAPLAWPMLQELGQGSVPGLLALADADSGGPLGRLLLETVEGDRQSVTTWTLDGRIGALVPEDPVRFQSGGRLVMFTHVVGVLLALSARGHGRWLGLAWAVGLWLVACGPVFVLGDWAARNSLYLAAMEQLDLLRRWWWPGRAGALVLPVLCALGGLALLRWSPRGRLALGGALLVGAVLQHAGEERVPMEAWSSQTSPGLACLAATDHAVLEVPWRGGQRPLYHQTVHGRPLMNGMLITKDAFVPEGLRRLMAENQLLIDLLRLGDRSDLTAPTGVTDADLSELQELGYGAVIFRLEAFVRTSGPRQRQTSDWGRVRRLMRSLLGDPTFEDDQLAIYPLDGSALDCAP